MLVDVNGNGVFNTEDTNGIAGVTVTLQTTNGVPVATNQTSASGSYVFTNVAPGSYVVVETDLPGWYSTGDSVPPNDNQVPVALTSGQASTGNNFLDAQLAQITGSVKLDVNGNGTADPADTNGVSPVVLKIYQGGTNLVATVTNNPDGSFAVSSLPPGDYTVVQTVPPGYTATTPTTVNVTLTSGSTGTANYLDTQPGSIAGSVLVDVNGNGVFNTEDTNGISGVTVVLETTNGVPVATNLTSASGNYVFTNVPPGSYVVVETDKSGWYSTGDSVPPNDNQVPVTLLSAQASTGNNFLDAQLAQITGSVKLDVNGNGIADSNDTNGISPVVINVYLNGTSLVATETNNPDGTFSVPGLPPGDYTVVQTVPPGYTATTPTTVNVTLTSGSTGTANYLDTQPGSIAGSVLVDVNGNGAFNAEDTNGISGVTVVLETTNGVLVATNLTSASGNYVFTNVPPGSYVVVETDKSGWYSTGDSVPPNDNQVPVALTSGQASTGNNFLDAQLAQITGSVKLDVNGNGTADPADTNGVSPVVLKIYQGGTNLVATVTNNPDGSFAVSNLPPGDYTVVQTVPPGYTATTPTTVNVTLTSGSTGTANYLDTQPGSIAGSVLVDVNGNGVFNTEDTNGISGVTVVLETTNGVPVATNLTSASGSYVFTNVPPGNYVVVETDKSGWYSTGDSVPPNDNQVPVTLLSAQASTGNNFLDAQLAQITGSVKLDVNGNGIADSNDTNGISPVVINVYLNGTSLVATETNNPDGTFSVPGLPPGNYTVVQTVPPGYTATTPTTVNVTLTSGSTGTANYLDTQPGSIAGSVLVDVNGNGAFNAEDTNGISGVTVVLETTNGVLVATNLTSASGNYVFTNVPPGSYVVVETDKSGWYSTGDSVPPNDNQVPVTLLSAQASTGNNFLDAQLAQITGSVKLDVNGNGTADPADTNGVSPVVLKIYQGGTNLVATVTNNPDGSFAVSNLPPGDYTVVQTVPPGYTATTPTTVNVTLTSGSTGTANYLDTQPGSIAGSVLVDVNGNGVFNTEDTNGISGVTVVLETTNGVPVATNLTSTSGSYVFTNVPPGNYVVVETDKSGWYSTGDSVPPNDNQVPVTLLSAQASTGNNFLDAQLAQITGSVKLDVNGNGIADSNDTNGISPVVINVYLNGTSLVATETNNPDGTFSVPYLPPGDYTVVQTVPPGYAATTPTTVNVTLTSGSTGTANYLDAQPVTIGDYVWVDANGNGVQDVGETGLAGVSVVLYRTNSGLGTLTAVATNISSSSGAYSFTGVAPGDFVVGFYPPEGWHYTVAYAGSDRNLDSDAGVNGLTAVFSLAPGQADQSIDAGFWQPATIGNQVWDDANNDGVLNPGEVGFDGVTVELWRDLNNDGVFEPTGADAQTPVSTVTAGGGFYYFTDVAPGQYFVCIPAPPPFHTLSSTHTTTVNNLVDNCDKGIQAGGPGTPTVSPPVMVMSGEVNNTIDFGFLDPSVGNLVWLDLNLNGRVDTNEPGVQGVIVELYDTNNVEVATTTTDENGYYLFEAQPPNKYYVKIPALNFLPGGALANYRAATPIVATNASDHVDDDSNGLQTEPGADVTSSLIELREGQEPTDDGTETGRGNFLDNGADSNGDMTVDFGFTGTGMIGDRVWVDANGNGLQDAGEPGLANVTVVLYRTNSGLGALTAIQTNVTTSTGAYSFAYLPDGEYVLGFELPGGYVCTSPLAGPDRTVDSDVLPGGLTGVISLGVGETNLTVDAGYYQEAALAGSVKVDVNGNGFADGNDTNGISPVVLNVYLNGTNLVATVTNNPDGTFSVPGLTPGDYSVVQTVPPGYTATTPTTVNVTLTSGSTGTANYLDTQPGSIAGSVKLDVNGNGTADPADTNGVSPVVLKIYQGGTNLVATVTNNPDGTFSVPGLPPGDYSVVQTVPPGYTATTPTTVNVTLTSGSTGTANYLDTQPGSIAGSVLVDVNGNGVFNTEDTNGISGVTVVLQTTNGVPVATNLTSASGGYLFTNLAPGSYVVVETDKSGWYSTGDSVPPNDNQVPVTLTSGQASTGNNFLDAQLAQITGSVKLDVNGNGTADPADTNGVSPVVLKIYQGGTNLVAIVTNNPDGSFAVSSLPPGNYTVVQTVPPGYTNTTPTAVNMTLTSGSTGTANYLDTPTFSIGNRVFADNGAGGGTANNGVQDGAEPGIANVALKLYAANGSGNPTGSLLGTTHTDTNGYYRFDGLRAGTYVVVVDVIGSGAALNGMITSTGWTTNLTLAGDLRDHGKDAVMVSRSVLPGGIASVPVQVGIGLQPTNEATAGSGAGANGPGGDTSDNLVVDFGFYSPPPTAAVLAWLGAYVDQGQVWVTWQTLSELDLLYFDVWRSAPSDGETDVTPDLVDADGRAVGHDYLVLDSMVPLPGKYTYRLVGWYDDGSTQELANVTVTLAKEASVDVIRITSLQVQTNGLLVQWIGGKPPYALYSSLEFGPGANWTQVGPAQPGEMEAVVPAQDSSGFFRVKGGK